MHVSSTIENRMGRARGDRRARSGVMMGLLIAAGAALVLPACTETNPNYCDGAKDASTCPGDKICINDMCVTPPDTDTNQGGKGGGGAGGAGTGGTAGAATGGAGGIATSDIDAQVAPDVPAVDLGPPLECVNDDQCAAFEGRKICVENKCSPCDTNKVAGCPTTRPFCSNIHQCVGCMQRLMEVANVCPADRPICAPEGWCAECTTFAECTKEPGKPLCASPAVGEPKKCSPCTMGGGSETCKARNSTLPACLPDGTCAECGVSMDCPADKPICGADRKCMPCTNDKQCADRGGPPGVCLIDPDVRPDAKPEVKGGRCATEAETIYVNTANCSDADSAKGVMATPRCTPQKAIDTITKDRRVVVVRGGPFEGFRIDKSDKSGTTPIWIVGATEGGPEVVIHPGGANPGIVITNVTADVRLRGLTIRGSQDIGVRADGKATVRLNRCVLEDNRRGGLNVTGGAGFDVGNTVFERNALGGSDAGAVGAAFLSPPDGGRPARFRASTLLGNLTGIVCTGSNINLTGVLLVGAGDQAFGCKPPTESKTDPTTDPGFDVARPGHLSATSPCRGVLSVANAPIDDIDGDLRDPDGDKQTDCGADEFR
jgi:hypothetical protein